MQRPGLLAAHRLQRRPAVRLLLSVSFIMTAGCSGFLDVEDPSLIDANALDPVRDGPTLALSALRDLAAVYGHLITYSAWFAGEALVADFLPPRNEFGLRAVAADNSSLLNDLWAPLSTARASADHALALLMRAPETRGSVYAATAALASGFSFLFMAEQFCRGAVNAGPPLDTNMMLDSAVLRFTRAIDITGAVTQVGADESAPDPAQIAAAARVGRARAHLQAGRMDDALEDATRVPAGFTFSLAYVDDPANRLRLSNRIWFFTAQRGAIAVAPAFRGLGDPRIPTRPPGPPLRPNDGITEFWTQSKYPDFSAPIRLASRLEAEYIAAEASGTAAMLELIHQRRIASEQSPYDGPRDDATVLAELMNQRVRDFYLEAKALGDLRRNGDAVRYAPQPGAPYHKAGFPLIGDQTCYPLPVRETANNPNFPRG